MLSAELEKTLHRALALASERKHELATLEHLLLALCDDLDAVAVLKACGVDVERLRQDLTSFVENELDNLAGESDEDAAPTTGFQRVLQRAVHHSDRLRLRHPFTLAALIEGVGHPRLLKQYTAFATWQRNPYVSNVQIIRN